MVDDDEDEKQFLRPLPVAAVKKGFHSPLRQNYPLDGADLVNSGNKHTLVFYLTSMHTEGPVSSA